MKKERSSVYGCLLSAVVLLTAACAAAETPPPVKVGVATILTTDLGTLGKNVVMTAETYRKHYLRHPLEFIYEDSGLSGPDGLRAYQKLTRMDKVDLIVCGSASNGTMAAKELINSTKTPTISIVTGGANIDAAGEYVFRIGSSDTLDGIQTAEEFAKQGRKRAALLTEETEYTQDISKFFVPRFKELGGEIVYNQNFLPGTSDFRTQVTAIKRSAPQAIFIPTQTGLALGLFLKQWHEQGGSRDVPVHTTFVAAPNPDAHAAAGELINGVYYMSPDYDRENPEWKKFLEFYRADHGVDPSIPFHSAGTVDTLNLLQDYLDGAKVYSRAGFKDFLLSHVKDYHGLMGSYSFDSAGNAKNGFRLQRISGVGID
jgi:branched-chain amino acid transport system substrate-binding protein